jgi:hypothetical protein
MPGWLYWLCPYLLVWVPLNFAALVNLSLPSIAERGPAAAVELAAHAAATILCAAAGWMLWVRNAGGRRLAVVALILNAVVTVQALSVSALPRDVSPGLALPLAALALLHTLGWILYLERSRALRAWLSGD